MTSVIEVAGLHKAYGDFEAVRGIDFDVSEGEIFGLLGPSGAGKTTTVEILEGLRARSQVQLKAAKRTILLTTHYIEEAERLCDRVAIIDQGRIVAMGSPRELQERVFGQSRIEVATALPMPVDLPAFEAVAKHSLSDDCKTLV